MPRCEVRRILLKSFYFCQVSFLWLPQFSADNKSLASNKDQPIPETLKTLSWGARSDSLKSKNAFKDQYSINFDSSSPMARPKSMQPRLKKILRQHAVLRNKLDYFAKTFFLFHIGEEKGLVSAHFLGIAIHHLKSQRYKGKHHPA